MIDGEIIPCDEVVCRAYQVSGQDMWWSENGRELILLRRDGPDRSMKGLYAWQPSTGAIRKIIQTDDWLSDCAPAGGRLICLYETWTRPRHIVSVEIEDGSISPLYDPNPQFADHRFSKIEKLTWEDAYGNTTYGHLVYPINYRPGHAYPLVFVTYQSRGFLRGGIGNDPKRRNAAGA